MAFFAIVAGVAKIFKRKNDQSHIANLVEVGKLSYNTSFKDEEQERLMSEELTENDNAIEKDKGIGGIGRKKQIAADIIYGMNSIYDHLRYGNGYDSDVSDTTDLTFSRMKGRWMGYLMALICDRMWEDVRNNLNPTFASPKPANAIFEVRDIDGEVQLVKKKYIWRDDKKYPDVVESPFKWENVQKKMSSEEIKAVEDIDAKMNDLQKEDILDYNLSERGIYEGMSVYIQKRPLSLLCDKKSTSD